MSYKGPYIVKTAKAHKCAVCGGLILLGELHQKITWLNRTTKKMETDRLHVTRQPYKNGPCNEFESRTQGFVVYDEP